MSETLVEVPSFNAPEAVHYTDRNGKVHVALVLEPATDETPAKLRVVRNGRTDVRHASLDTETGTYKRAADPVPAIPEVVPYIDSQGNLRPALVVTAETEESAATLTVLRNNGSTQVRKARKDPDNTLGAYRKVASPSWNDHYDADPDPDADEDEDNEL